MNFPKNDKKQDRQFFGTFRSVMTFALMLATIIPTLVFGIVFVGYLQSNTRTDAKRELDLFAQSIAERLERHFLVTLLQFRNLARDNDVYLATRSLLFYNNAEARLSAFAHDNPLVERLFLVDKNMEVILAYPGISQSHASLYALVPWAQKLQKDGSDNEEISYASGNYIIQTLPLQTQIGFTQKERIIVEFSYARSAEILRKDYPTSLEFYVQHGTKNGIIEKDEYRIQNRQVVSAKAFLPTLIKMSKENAQIVVIDDAEKRFAKVNSTILWTSIALLIALLITAGLAYITARAFLSPLQKLVKEVSTLGQVEQKQLTFDYHFSEFKLLSSCINDQKITIAQQFDKLNATVAHLRDLNMRMCELQDAQEQAQMAVLKSQMNPHLLFNTLNSILSMLDFDPKAASTMITNLADLYRLILRGSKKAFSDLGTEVHIVNLYLELERVRFSDRLGYTIDVPPKFHHLPIPGLILQTLVENAVKHGIARSAAGGHIAVIASSTLSHQVLIKVVNTGAPLTEIRKESQTAGEGGTGLVNTQRRLDLMYSLGHAFRIYTGDKGQTIAEFLIRENFDDEKDPRS